MRPSKPATTMTSSAMERKRAEEHYRELVELSPNAILVHCEGRIVFANSATARLLGATHPAELNGRSIYDFVHGLRSWSRCLGTHHINRSQRRLPSIECVC